MAAEAARALPDAVEHLLRAASERIDRQAAALVARGERVRGHVAVVLDLDSPILRHGLSAAALARLGRGLEDGEPFAGLVPVDVASRMLVALLPDADEPRRRLQTAPLGGEFWVLVVEGWNAWLLVGSPTLPPRPA